MRFINWLKSVFKKKEAIVIEFPKAPEQKPEPVAIPEEKPSAPITKDTVNDGTTKSPDWTYLWDNMVIDSKKKLEIEQACARIIRNKAKYKDVELKTGVPWDLIAALHYREASLDFSTCLHNGDKLPGPTRNVPSGRGPFKSWEEAAIDAIKYDGLDKVKFIDVISKLVMAHKYNGIGYLKKGIYSPYIWAGSNHYTRGKYTSDGWYDSNAIDKQLGVAVILKALQEMES